MDVPWARGMPATRVSTGGKALLCVALDCMRSGDVTPVEWMVVGDIPECVLGNWVLHVCIVARVPLVPCPPLTAEPS